MDDKAYYDFVREFPKLKHIPSKPQRYSEKDFNDYEELKQNDHFIKWRNGINPYTNRKIQIGGKTHCNVLYKMNQQNTTKIKNYQYYNNISQFNKDDYLKENIDITKKYNDQVAIVQKYNDTVLTITEQIEKLLWNDYIVFNDRKYGIPKVYNNVHRENDCMGTIFCEKSEGCTCHSCEDWFGCSAPTGTNYMKCKKCGYSYTIQETYSKNYKGK